MYKARFSFSCFEYRSTTSKAVNITGGFMFEINFSDEDLKQYARQEGIEYQNYNDTKHDILQSFALDHMDKAFSDHGQISLESIKTQTHKEQEN